MFSVRNRSSNSPRVWFFYLHTEVSLLTILMGRRHYFWPTGICISIVVIYVTLTDIPMCASCICDCFLYDYMLNCRGEIDPYVLKDTKRVRKDLESRKRLEIRKRLSESEGTNG